MGSKKEVRRVETCAATSVTEALCRKLIVACLHIAVFVLQLLLVLISPTTYVGTNRIHGERSMISRQNFKNVSNFTENSRKEFRKFTGPTDVISRCCGIANEEISEQRIFTTLSQDSRQSMSTT